MSLKRQFTYFKAVGKLVNQRKFEVMSNILIENISVLFENQPRKSL